MIHMYKYVSIKQLTREKELYLCRHQLITETNVMTNVYKNLNKEQTIDMTNMASGIQQIVSLIIALLK